jgi:hypothetical protein
MELIKPKKEKPNILAEITCIQEPFEAFYISENLVLISGKEQWGNVDTITNQTFHSGDNDDRDRLRMQEYISNYYNFCASSCKFTNDRPVIVSGSKHKIYFGKPNQIPHLTLTTKQHRNTSYFSGMQTHPNNKILIIITTIWDDILMYNYILEYWCMDTFKLITTTKLPLNSDNQMPSPRFSPSGRKLLVIRDSVYVELEVPFEVIYKNITKKEFPYLLFLLKNYTSQCDDIEIPQDINVLLAHTLLDLYKPE